MSFVKIDRNNFEYVTLNVKPELSFISSSLGVTGSEYIAPIRSKCLKNLIPTTFDLNGDGETTFGEAIFAVASSPAGTLHSMQNNPLSYDLANAHLSAVNNANTIAKFDKTIDVFRIDQPGTFNKNKVVKNVVKNVLMKQHQHRYENCNFTYTNYNSLNFFTSETIPTGSALIYPNVELPALGRGAYDLPDSFSVNFWINPRYSSTSEYHPGTILHISSSIAISLITGSSPTRNEFNEYKDFKILVQLSQSADIPPSSLDTNNLSKVFPADLIFTSSFSLSKNHWHHVCVQWGNAYHNSSGSIIIDEGETFFHVPSASLHADPNNTPSGIIIGNFYDGSVTNLADILNDDIAALEGFTGVGPAIPGAPGINENTFSHPLNAEIHELKIFDIPLKTEVSCENSNLVTPSEYELVKSQGVSSLDNLRFYLPPFFYPETSTREVLNTPFQTVTSTTDDPINVGFSFGVNGKLINLENFTREFVIGQQPRLLGLVPEIISTYTSDLTPDEYVYDSGANKKRNMTILPNDNGLFKPNYFVLSSSPMSESIKFYSSGNKSIGLPDYSIVSLENLIPTSSLFPGLVQSTGSMFDAVVEAGAQNPGVNQGEVLTIAQRTKDVSSNEVTIYDISNIYYGNRIHPGSFEVFEEDLTGSDGKIKIRLRDNERGSLYRADCLTEQAKWNNVGSIFYDEGIAMIKSPHLFYFNKDKTHISFKGEQNIHTMMLNIPAYKELFNSSSNPTYQKYTPSDNINDQHLSAVYVSTVNIHDNNFNIIMKANFAQPILKTEEDEFVIRLKEDF